MKLLCLFFACTLLSSAGDIDVTWQPGEAKTFSFVRTVYESEDGVLSMQGVDTTNVQFVVGEKLRGEVTIDVVPEESVSSEMVERMAEKALQNLNGYEAIEEVEPQLIFNSSKRQFDVGNWEEFKQSTIAMQNFLQQAIDSIQQENEESRDNSDSNKVKEMGNFLVSMLMGVIEEGTQTLQNRNNVVTASLDDLYFLSLLYDAEFVEGVPVVDTRTFFPPVNFGKPVECTVTRTLTRVENDVATVDIVMDFSSESFIKGAKEMIFVLVNGMPAEQLEQVRAKVDKDFEGASMELQVSMSLQIDVNSGWVTGGTSKLVYQTSSPKKDDTNIVNETVIVVQ